MKIKFINPKSAGQFVRDYRLPIGATAMFVALVVFMLVGRLQDRSTLGQILAVSNSGGQGYANLLSKDKADLFTKNNVSDTDTPQPSNNPAAVTANAAPNTNSTETPAPTGGGNTPLPAPSPSPTPTPVFSAHIMDFRQSKAPTLQCSIGNPNGGNISKCTKTYSFASGVQTQNGPGTVSYAWRYSVSGSTNGSFVAAGGTSSTSLGDEITLSCRESYTFTAQFVITNPGSSQSPALQITHNCTL